MKNGILSLSKLISMIYLNTPSLPTRPQCHWLNEYHALVSRVVGGELAAQAGRTQGHNSDRGARWVATKTAPLHCQGGPEDASRGKSRSALVYEASTAGAACWGSHGVLGVLAGAVLVVAGRW